MPLCPLSKCKSPIVSLGGRLWPCLPPGAISLFINPSVALCACVLQFDELQTCSGPGVPLRRPQCNTLLDVFNNIRDDEVEHVKTMHACQDPHRIAQDLADKRKKFAAEGLSKDL